MLIAEKIYALNTKRIADPSETSPEAAMVRDESLNNHSLWGGDALHTAGLHVFTHCISLAGAALAWIYSICIWNLSSPSLSRVCTRTNTQILLEIVASYFNKFSL